MSQKRRITARRILVLAAMAAGLALASVPADAQAQGEPTTGAAGDLPAEPDWLPPPPGSSHHPAGGPLVPVAGPDQPRKRPTPKPRPKGGEPFASNTPAGAEDPGAWRQLGFSSGSFTPEPGLDPRLAVAATARAGAGKPHVYGFLLTDELLSAETETELNRWGVTLLGPHASAYKVKLPSDVGQLEAVALLPYVRWIGFSQPQQKLSSDLRQALVERAAASDPYPVVVNLFDDDGDESFRRQIETAGAIVASYDAELQAYTAVASSLALDAIVELDFVLFVELVQVMSPYHDQSMALIGADYIRPGGPGTSFDASPIIVGIMDSGFMLGSAAPVMHQDLSKYGCGENFTTDSAGVWDDENGHGTHVLTTIVGTGTADGRYRGVAVGVGGSGTTRIRAAKVFTAAGGGSSTWTHDAMDFLDDATACDSPRPVVVNYSGGADGAYLVGTDASSRKLDEKSWSYGQLYVVAAGNAGSSAGTVGAPGVAKNALTVGNVRDYSYSTVGDVWTSSSRGPTGDGRMKPNLVAPGRWVSSARAGTTGQYVSFSGTSMATPHVAGLAATLMEHYPSFVGRPYLARAYLMASSLLHDDVTIPSDNGAGGTRPHYGLGRVSAYVAHWARSNPNGWTGHWWWGTITGSQYLYADLAVPSGTDRLVVVLSWDEPAASAGASQAVIDDVELWVDRGADCIGGTHLGGCGEYDSLSSTDSIEYVIINNPPAATYRLKATPWSVSASRPVAIAAIIVRGDPTPNMTLTASASTTSPLLNGNFTVTTTVSNPSWIASGVHLERTSFPGGITPVSVTTTREDNVTMDFGTAGGLTLGNIHEGDSRSVVWTFKATTMSAKTLSFRAWSENGGTRSVNVVIDPAMLFTDGFESGDTSAWSGTVP